MQEWATSNPDKVRKKAAEYQNRHGKRISARKAERRKSDPAYLLGGRISHQMREALKAGKAGRRWEAIVGYSLRDLMAHLEKQFLPNMGWHNIGSWHVDHILPRAMFDYRSSDDDAFKACWALTNLRPLWSGVNMSKGSKRLFLI